MDWDTLAETLNQEQRRLQELVEGIRVQQEGYRPGVDWDDLIERPAPQLLHSVDSNIAHPNLPLAAMAVAQMKFNQAVISLLTETVMYDPDALRGMDREAQIETMRQWFFALYEDPAQETPYSGSDGGYFYIHGGPYDAEEELREEFEEIVGEESIMALVNELADLGHEWAPTIRHPKYTE